MPELYASGAALGALVAAAVFASLARGAVLAVVYPLCAAASIVLGAVDLRVLLTGAEAALWLPIGLPAIGLHLRLDPLSAFFGIVINGGVLAASVYGMGFDRVRELSRRVEPLFPLFAAAMNVVLIADDAGDDHAGEQQHDAEQRAAPDACRHDRVPDGRGFDGGRVE